MTLTNLKVSHLAGFALRLLLALLLWGCLHRSSQAQLLDSSRWQTGVQNLADLPTGRSVKYEFSQTDLASIVQRLRYFGLEAPFDLAGSVSGWLWLQRSEEGILDWGGYRVELEFSSPELTIDQWVFNDSVLRIGYGQGSWYVGALRGELVSRVDSNTSVGRFHLNATLPLKDEDQRIALGGQVRGLSIDQLLAELEGGLEVPSANATAEFRFSALSSDIGRLGAWSGIAIADLEGIEFSNSEEMQLRAVLKLENGAWRTEVLSAVAGDTRVDGTASGKLTTELPYKLAVPPSRVGCEQLWALIGFEEMPLKLAGELGLSGSLEGDRKGIANIKADIDSDNLSVGGFKVEKLLAKVLASGVEDGQLPLVLTLQRLSFANGKASGRASWPSLQSLVESLPNELVVTLDRLDIRQLPQKLTRLNLAGIGSGKIHLWQDANGNLELNSDLKISDAEVSGAPLGTLDLAVRQTRAAGMHAVLRDVAETLAVEVQFGEFAAKNLFELSGPLPYVARGKLSGFKTQIPTENGRKCLPISLGGDFLLRGDQSLWLNAGNAQLTTVKAVLGGQQVELKDALLTITPESFTLNRFYVFDRLGKIVGSAQLQRKPNGKHLVQLRSSKLKLGRYIREYAPEILRQASAEFDGSVVATASAFAPLSSRDWQIDYEGQLNETRYRGAKVGDLAARGSLKNGLFESTLSGQLFSGELNLSCSGSLSDSPTEPIELVKLDGNIEGMRISEVLAAAVDARFAARYRGQVNASIGGSFSGGAVTFASTIVVPSLMRDRLVLARDLELRSELNDDQLRILELNGAVAGGRLTCQGTVDSVFSRAAATDVFLSADRLSLDALLSTYSSDLAGMANGRLSYRGRLRGVGDWDLDGTARLRDAELWAFPVDDVRGSVHCDIGSDGLEEVVAADIHGDILGGKADADFKMRVNSRVEAKSSFSLRGGRLDELSRALGFNHIGGRGVFNAQAKLTSKDLRNLSQLRGPFRVDFSRGDSQSLPLLADMSRIIPLAQFASTKITGGSANGQLGQGYVTINNLLVNSKSYWLAASGRAALASQRLDFEAVVHTGSGLDATVGQAISSELLLVIAPQLALLNEVGEVVNNRTVYIEVLGTAQHPVVRLQAAQTVAKAFLQNLQRELLVSPNVDFGNN